MGLDLESVVGVCGSTVTSPNSTIASKIALQAQMYVMEHYYEIKRHAYM